MMGSDLANDLIGEDHIGSHRITRFLHYSTMPVGELSMFKSVGLRGTCTNTSRIVWRFPDMKVPLKHPCYLGNFHWKPSIPGYPHDYGHPRVWPEHDQCFTGASFLKPITEYYGP